MKNNNFDSKINEKDMGYNYLPPFTKEITEEEYRERIFIWSLKKPENRQVHYNHEIFTKGTFNFMIFWLDVTNTDGLGYGVANDWKEKKLRFYKIGNPEKWKSFNEDVRIMNSGDNS